MNTLKLTAVEAAEIHAIGERRRAGHCVTIMDYTLADIAKVARAGKRAYVVRGVGIGVNLEAYIAELELLGYKVRLETIASRDVLVEW